MRVFIAYSSDATEIAEQVFLSLLGDGHRVFFDKSSLRPTDNFDSKIRSEIRKSDLFIFLISPNSIATGSYALTELKFAQEKWRHPGRSVLPALAKPTDRSRVPNYLNATTILETPGKVAPEVRAWVESQKQIPKFWVRSRSTTSIIVALVLLLVCLALLLRYWFYRDAELVGCRILLPHMALLQRHYGHNGIAGGIGEWQFALEARTALMNDMATNTIDTRMKAIVQKAIDASEDAKTDEQTDASTRQKSQRIKDALTELQGSCRCIHCRILLPHMALLQRHYGHNGIAGGINERPFAIEAHVALKNYIATNTVDVRIRNIVQKANNASVNAKDAVQTESSSQQNSITISDALAELERICR